jgi:hypothetical protein
LLLLKGFRAAAARLVVTAAAAPERMDPPSLARRVATTTSGKMVDDMTVEDVAPALVGPETVELAEGLP